MSTPDIAVPRRQAHATPHPSGRPGGGRTTKVTLRERRSDRPARPRQPRTRLTRKDTEPRPASRRDAQDRHGRQSTVAAPSGRSSGATWVSKDVIRRYRELGYLWQPAETPASA